MLQLACPRYACTCGAQFEPSLQAVAAARPRQFNLWWSRVRVQLLQHVAGERSTTDWNNALKLGFDPHSLAFPLQLRSQPWSHLLPQRVLQPGAPIARVCPEAAARTGLPGSCEVVAGTTDSIAAFLAAGVAPACTSVTAAMHCRIAASIAIAK